jgi:hypothetical protein
MSGLIADLDYLSWTRPAGAEYYVSISAEMDSGARWKAWIEFVPLDDSGVFVTPTLTHQPTRAAVEHWATTFGTAYIESVFQRAVSAAPLLPPSRVVARLQRQRWRSRHLPGSILLRCSATANRCSVREEPAVDGIWRACVLDMVRSEIQHRG